jgi:hypothetical protein
MSRAICGAKGEGGIPRMSMRSSGLRCTVGFLCHVSATREQSGDRDIFIEHFPMESGAAHFDLRPLCRRRAQETRKPRGTPRVRPSVRSTHMVGSSKRTLVAEMLMPRLQDQATVVVDSLQDSRQFAGVEAVAVRYGYVRFQPDLGIPAAAFDVNVRRLRWQIPRSSRRSSAGT